MTNMWCRNGDAARPNFYDNTFCINLFPLADASEADDFSNHWGILSQCFQHYSVIILLFIEIFLYFCLYVFKVVCSKFVVIFVQLRNFELRAMNLQQTFKTSWHKYGKSVNDYSYWIELYTLWQKEELFIISFFCLNVFSWHLHVGKTYHA